MSWANKSGKSAAYQFVSKPKAPKKVVVKKKQMNVNVDPVLKERLDKASSETGYRQGEIIEKALERLLDEWGIV